MAQRNIKRTVGDAIAAYFAANVTGLTGRVSAVQAGPEKTQEFPSVALLPNTFDFQPFEPDEVYWDAVTDDGKVLINVGEFDGIYELQLYAKSVPEREIYEQRIMDLMLSTPGAPGTLYVTLPALLVGGYQSLYAPEIKVRLDSEEWREEFSFESRRYSFLDLEISFPALVARDAYTIESLQSAITNDLESDTPDDIVEVQEDGSTLPVS